MPSCSCLAGLGFARRLAGWPRSCSTRSPSSYGTSFVSLVLDCISPAQSCLPRPSLTPLARSCLHLPRIPPPAASPALAPAPPATIFEPQLRFEYVTGVVVCFFVSFVSFTSHLWCLCPCPSFVSFAVRPHRLHLRPLRLRCLRPHRPRLPLSFATPVHVSFVPPVIASFAFPPDVSVRPRVWIRRPRSADLNHRTANAVRWCCWVLVSPV